MLDDALWFNEYGAPFDLRQLPARQFEAHMEIIRGRMEKRKEQHDEIENAT